jgi:hypothetical protein
MANEPYDPYIPGGSKDAAQGTSNPKTAAIQQQIDDTVLLLLILLIIGRNYER